MVTPFQFSRLPLINFGPGKIKLLPGLLKKYGSAIILVTDQTSFMGTSFSAELLESLRKLEIRYHHFPVSGEPSDEVIDAAVRKYMDESVDTVVSIGGGSVLDAGKAISAMMYKQEPVIEFLEGVGTREHPGTKLPFIALPTTSGTGSEVTKNAVISRVGENGFKKSLRHDNLVPDIAIIDPELTISCPKDITAASGMDCFTQLTEAYLSEKGSEYTEALAWQGLREIKSSLLQSYHQGNDIKARSGMSFAALTSGICLANAGLGVVHGFASSIGGMFSVPHGVICGTLMAEANAVTLREIRKSNNNSEALIKYAGLGKLFLDNEGKTDDYYIDGFVDILRNLTFQMQLPRLNRYGIEEKDVEKICRVTELKNNPVKLSLDDLTEIIRERL
jgi:alcohol dehydrogenase class IV